MEKNTFVGVGILLMIILASCEEEYPDCPECMECELEHLGLNSEWGEKVKAELTSLFIDIEDLALMRVFNTSGDILHWSGFDAGNPMEDSRQIQVDLLETELVLIWKRFVDGKWNHSLIRVRYNDITTTILQNVTFIRGGQVYRRANNVLIYASDKFTPLETDGATANAAIPEGVKQTFSREILRK